MNHLEKKDKRTFKERFWHLPQSTKFYLSFNALATILAIVISGIIVANEASALGGLVKAILILSVIYILIASPVINLGLVYNRERNIVAALIPLLMSIIGLALAFWLYDEYLNDQIGIMTIALSAATITVVPIIGFSLSRALAIETKKIYFICFCQIIGVALIAWLEFSLFI